MINIKNGNLLEAKENIIVHQVNVDGIMGGGVAKQLADRFQDLEKFYAKHCEYLNNSYEFLNGTVLFYGSGNKIIANMFSQFPNFETDYEAMKIALNYIKKWASNNNRTIAIPYRNRMSELQKVIGTQFTR